MNHSLQLQRQLAEQFHRRSAPAPRQPDTPRGGGSSRPVPPGFRWGWCCSAWPACCCLTGAWSGALWWPVRFVLCRLLALLQTALLRPLQFTRECLLAGGVKPVAPLPLRRMLGWPVVVAATGLFYFR